MSQSWNQQQGHETPVDGGEVASSGAGTAETTAENLGTSGAGGASGHGEGSHNSSNSERKYLLPSLGGFENGSSRLPSMSAPQTSNGSPPSKGFSLASLNNPLPSQPEPQNVGGVGSQGPATLPEVSSPQSFQGSLLNPRGPLGPDSTQDLSYRPLNVKDALSYLEQVKFQFSNRPDVYNHFLDIMKDFKSQVIDTPGVIERVSTLFQGFPTLIQGFNTFLPQGYKIECSMNPNDPHPIKVTTPYDIHNEQPLGLRTTPVGEASEHPAAPVSSTDASNPPRPEDMSESGNFNVAEQQTQIQDLEAAQVENMRQNQLQNLHPQHLQQRQQETPPNATVAAQNATHLPSLAQQQTAYQQERKAGDIEFSHAISYVNKIKTRFADQPDIYKRFLEILQTYQREQKPIHEVYGQVTILFQNAPDLLDDFKKFLPDANAAHQHQQHGLQSHQQVHLQQPPYSQQQTAQSQSNRAPLNGPGPYFPPQQVPSQSLPPLGSFSPPVNGREGESRMALPAVQAPAVELAPEQQGVAHHIVTQGMSNDAIPISELRTPINGNYYPHVNQAANLQYVESISRPEIDLDPSLVPVIPEPIKPIEDDINLIEESSFFDKAKKHIGNKQVYTEFLKILNLFSQDLIELDELVHRVSYYLDSNKELIDWFKGFVGYVEKPKHIENIVHEKHRLDLDLCEACGPSYKKLPKTDTFMPCSGRDEMCWEVLNDEWVGHPVWASEDSGFIAHRKNQYEETLFKIEEERHEYDYYIEANLRTIQTLETIANKIANMTAEEKASFKLPPGLGHTSTTIYKKVIRKIYDKDRGFEIIEALHENPAISVPIVLKRLKQKDEEWRRAQREWNKVWRELEQKVFFKSLDHLGLTFKQADKKLLTAKQLVSEISSIKVDQTNKRLYPLTPKQKSQLDFDIKDKEILYDVLYLVSIFVDHNCTYSVGDKEKIMEFFKLLISIFFSLPLKEVAKSLSEREGTDSTKHSEDENGTDGQSKKRSRENEPFFQELLRSRSKTSKSEQPDLVDNTQINLSDGVEEEELIRQEAKKPWLLGTILEESDFHGFVPNRKVFNLFANTNIYVFFRHLFTLYSRLHEVKQMNAEVTKDIGNRRTSQFAKDLNLISTQLSEMGLDFEVSDAYKQLLALCKKLIENNIEHQWFEESLRQAYKNKAFKIYTVDKVVQAVVKHSHAIVTDVKTVEIMSLFEKDRASKSTSAKEQILYRLQVRSFMGLLENMFRIEYNESTSHVAIQFVAVDDLTLKQSDSMQDRWKYYLTSYSLSHPTEGISHEDIRMPFLDKSVDDESDAQEDGDKPSPAGISISQMKVKVDPKTYALEIEPQSKDVFSRSAVNRCPSKLLDTTEASRQEKRKAVNAFLDSSKGWKRGLTQEDVAKGAEDVKKHLGNVSGSTAERPGLEDYVAQGQNGHPFPTPNTEVNVDDPQNVAMSTSGGT
ncbi:LAMI_0B07690g1_1 [Lachancea mirantina]|uniref:LAMI_0B07690g1_1 n=1 Tax=Lachancea mirantina TaxID=1230905 RepID=A0A1G4IXM3_9SACH|nr:LAMI_0B07690g1_1 [Lachancea mirantina]